MCTGKECVNVVCRSRVRFRVIRIIHCFLAAFSHPDHETACVMICLACSSVLLSGHVVMHVNLVPKVNRVVLYG